LRPAGWSSCRYAIGSLPATPWCSRRRASGRACVAGPAPRRHRARPELLSPVPKPFDAATTAGDDHRFGARSAAASYGLRSRFFMNTGDTNWGNNGKRKLLKQAALPLPCAVRAERSHGTDANLFLTVKRRSSQPSPQLLILVSLLPAFLAGTFPR